MTKQNRRRQGSITEFFLELLNWFLPMISQTNSALEAPRDYLDENNLYDELNRVASLHDSPYSKCKIEEMAAIGFYYHREKQVICCVGCDVEVHDWKPSTKPIVKHWIVNPNCTFGLQDKLSLRFKPSYAEYASLEKRIDSFGMNIYPETQSPQSMAEAGFFRSGGHVKCFYCGTEPVGWRPDDKPWDMHMIWSPYCYYLTETKGETPFGINRARTLGANIECDKTGYIDNRSNFIAVN